VAGDPTRLFLQVREKPRTGSAGVTSARVDVRVEGGNDALYSSCLLLNKTIAIVGREQVVFLVAINDVEVLDARVQQLQLGALVLEVQPATMPAFDFTHTLWTARRAALTLDETSPSPFGSRMRCNLGGGNLGGGM